MAGGSGSPTLTGKDIEYAFAPHQPRASTTFGQVSPLGQRPLGAEGVRVSREAMEGRYVLIRKELLPRLGELIKALHAASLAGRIGPGEISLLGELQQWLLQLQLEEDELTRMLKKPRGGQKK